MELCVSFWYDFHVRSCLLAPHFGRNCVLYSDGWIDGCDFSVSNSFSHFLCSNLLAVTHTHIHSRQRRTRIEREKYFRKHLHGRWQSGTKRLISTARKTYDQTNWSGDHSNQIRCKLHSFTYTKIQRLEPKRSNGNGRWCATIADDARSINSNYMNAASILNLYAKRNQKKN